MFRTRKPILFLSCIFLSSRRCARNENGGKSKKKKHAKRVPHFVFEMLRMWRRYLRTYMARGVLETRNDGKRAWFWTIITLMIAKVWSTGTPSLFLTVKATMWPSLRKQKTWGKPSFFLSCFFFVKIAKTIFNCLWRRWFKKDGRTCCAKGGYWLPRQKVRCFF